MFYGGFLFFAMPAAGVIVVVAGLICMNAGLRGKQRTDERPDGRSVREGKKFKDKCLRTLAGLKQQPDAGPKGVPTRKGYKIAAALVFISNFL
jgi:hypothetical protein